MFNPRVKFECTFSAAITSTLSLLRPVTHPNYPSLLANHSKNLIKRRWEGGGGGRRRDVTCVCACGHLLTGDTQHHTYKEGLSPEDHMGTHESTVSHTRSSPAADDLRAGWSNQYCSRYRIQKKTSQVYLKLCESGL